MGYIVFDEEYYKKMKQHYEAKGVKCMSAKSFQSIQDVRSATYTLKPHATPFVISKR